MTSDQAYDVVFQFLERFWIKHKKEYDDDLPCLLTYMSKTVWSDGTPGDPAYTRIWQECSSFKTDMTADDAFEALINILEEYISLGEYESKDISRLLAEIRSNLTIHRRIFDEIAHNISV